MHRYLAEWLAKIAEVGVHRQVRGYVIDVTIALL